MENQAITWTNRVGNWISAIILGNTRELIARIDERTLQMYDDLKENIRPDLKNVRERLAALEDGINVATVRRIGGIYFRDMALLQARFKPEDLDKPKSV